MNGLDYGNIIQNLRAAHTIRRIFQKVELILHFFCYCSTNGKRLAYEFCIEFKIIRYDLCLKLHQLG